MKYKLTSALFSALLIVAVSGTVAQAQAVIENTGPGSTNTITTGGGDGCGDFESDDYINGQYLQGSNCCTIENITDIDINVNTDQDANSGDATNSGNTTGGGASSGNANNDSDTNVDIDVNNGTGCGGDGDDPADPGDPGRPFNPQKPTSPSDPQVLGEEEINVGGGVVPVLADTAGPSAAAYAAVAMAAIGVGAVVGRVASTFVRK